MQNYSVYPIIKSLKLINNYIFRNSTQIPIRNISNNAAKKYTRICSMKSTFIIIRNRVLAVIRSIGILSLSSLKLQDSCMNLA